MPEAEIEHATSPADEFEDDDFGSFDDASFEEFSEPTEPQTAPLAVESHQEGVFDEEVFENPEKFEARLAELLDQLFITIKDDPDPSKDANSALLSDRSNEIFHALLAVPHLQPPNWVRLKIRHNLLLKLGIPINLDETTPVTSLGAKTEPRLHQRKNSIRETDISWQGFDIPAIEELQLSVSEKAQKLASTASLLSQIESDNMNNSTAQFLHGLADEKALDAKLQQFEQNYELLIELSCVWKSQLHDLKQDSEIYESVVQNMIGYSQKLRREEIFESLGKLKTKKDLRKKRMLFWR